MLQPTKNSDRLKLPTVRLDSRRLRRASRQAVLENRAEEIVELRSGGLASLRTNIAS
jgi:hypothetical protein